MRPFLAYFLTLISHILTCPLCEDARLVGSKGFQATWKVPAADQFRKVSRKDCLPVHALNCLTLLLGVLASHLLMQGSAEAVANSVC